MCYCPSTEKHQKVASECKIQIYYQNEIFYDLYHLCVYVKPTNTLKYIIFLYISKTPLTNLYSQNKFLEGSCKSKLACFQDYFPLHNPTSNLSSNTSKNGPGYLKLFLKYQANPSLRGVCLFGSSSLLCGFRICLNISYVIKIYL